MNFKKVHPDFGIEIKDIKINKLSEFDEILLIGSGKGVASVKRIKDYSWSRKSMKFYNLFSSTYLKAIKQCKKY